MANLKRIEQIYHQASALPPADRIACLEEACQGDDELRSEVEKLLRARDLADGFLTPPDRDGLEVSLTVVLGDTGDEVGARLGRYRIVQEIGAGGFGTVYMAEQQEPIIRMVALKILKLGMDTKQVIARFEAERQALAMMDHPNIAAVFDAAATSRGRPYFVMELVRGIPITEYLDQNNVPVRERLEIFLHVCSAVQHAHSKGIIHRDIKPSNVMVTLHDGAPVPKVIDFGIAKAVNQRLTEKTLFTQFGEFIGTPSYMSPEQAEMSGLDVDTRSDIYALGVLLYELITGTTPFDANRLHKAGIQEIYRILREEEPAQPSHRVSSMGPRSSAVAKSRAVSTDRLAKTIRGDLDWITLKALEKDRTRRYETASAMAEDVERFLKGEPISARSPSASYRFRKLVYRNRGKTLAAAAIFMALLVGFTAAIYGLIEAREQRDIATVEAARAGRVVELMQDILSPAGRHGVHLPNVTLRETLDEFSNRTRGKDFGDPEVEATLRHTMGNAYKTLGELDESGRLLKRALELRIENLGPNDLRTAETTLDWGWQLHDTGQYDDAGAAFESSLALYEELAGESHPYTAESYLGLGDILRHQSDLDGAELYTRKALEMRRAMFGGEHTRVAAAMNNLALVMRDRGDWTAAERIQRDALAMRRRILEPEHSEIAISCLNLAETLKHLQRYGEAQSLCEEALRIRRHAFGSDNHLVASAAAELGHTLLVIDRPDEAEAYLRESLDIRNRIMANSWLCTNSMSLLGESIARQGRYEEAETLLLTTFERFEPDQARRSQAHATANRLAALYVAWGRDRSAARWRTRAEELNGES